MPGQASVSTLLSSVRRLSRPVAALVAVAIEERSSSLSMTEIKLKLQLTFRLPLEFQIQ
jgi:hypothetical protein